MNRQSAFSRLLAVESLLSRRGNIELKHSSLESELKVLSNKFHSKCAAYDETISELNNQISELKQTATSLTKTNASLQYTIDEVEQYERRDSLVFSGKCIPKEQENETPQISYSKFFVKHFS